MSVVQLVLVVSAFWLDGCDAMLVSSADVVVVACSDCLWFSWRQMQGHPGVRHTYPGSCYFEISISGHWHNST